MISISRQAADGGRDRRAAAAAAAKAAEKTAAAEVVEGARRGGRGRGRAEVGKGESWARRVP